VKTIDEGIEILTENLGANSRPTAPILKNHHYLVNGKLKSLAEVEEIQGRRRGRPAPEDKGKGKAGKVKNRS